MIPDAPPPYRTIVFDCDSTLSAIEGIDELAAGRKREIGELTDRAMRGEIALEAVYKHRLELIRPRRQAVEAVGCSYIAHVLPHARELVRALHSLDKRVCVVSGGLEPAVRALARSIDVREEDVHSVAIRHDPSGAYAGFDERSPLARSGGKLEVLRAIAADRRAGPVVMIGDGITDLEVAPVVARFVAFGGVVRRAPVFERARVGTTSADLAALLPLVCTEEEIDILARDPEHVALVRAARELN